MAEQEEIIFEGRVKADQIHLNTDQEVVVITLDKLQLLLLKYQGTFESRVSFLAPLSVFITLLVTVIAVDFVDRFGIPKEYWEAGFHILAAIFLLWSVVAIAKAVKAMTLDQLVAEIKAISTSD